MTKFVAVAGNIATGKTTLVSSLGQQLGWVSHIEEPDKNPFLARYYVAPQRWGFHSQMWFLCEKAAKLRAIAKGTHSSVLDRTLYEDNLFAKLSLQPEECKLYLRFYAVVERDAPVPYLLIFLRVSTQEIVRRIECRGYAYERSVRREYLEALNEKYEDWIARWNRSPVVFMDWSDCSPRAYRERLHRIVDEIGRLGLR